MPDAVLILLILLSIEVLKLFIIWLAARAGKMK